MAWYAIYTRPRWEKKVHESLVEKEIEAFLPLRKTLRQWSDRKKWVEVPLFSGYIFVNVNKKQYYDAINVNGAVRYISFRGEPAEVPEKQITAIKLYLEQMPDEEKELENLTPGDEVEIIAGPLKGLSGILHSNTNKNKVGIHIDSVGQIIKVEVSRNKLKVISSHS